MNRIKYVLQVYFAAWSTFFPPDLKEDFFSPTAPWAVSWTEQSLLQGCVNLIAFVSAEPSLLCYPYRVSVTRFINHFQCLLSIPTLLICELGACFSDNVGVLKVGLHPRSTGSPSPCWGPPGNQREKGRTRQPEFICTFLLPMMISQKIFSWEMAEAESISNDFKRTMLSSHTWGNCRLYRGREATFWNVIAKHNCKMKSNLNVLLDKNH